MILLPRNRRRRRNLKDSLVLDNFPVEIMKILINKLAVGTHDGMTECILMRTIVIMSPVSITIDKYGCVDG